ncbi:phosphoglucosamine mutase [Naumannella halotolerans]|uniref:Phosphoglucosamine mutase n=1 Tax=Naumannella halotolerans TaxID=993414 RepID=A0A4R7J9M4_9ACTN|nr:phosphoglucosamine mutase [Naumannella halotolerans]TDT34242.1 phosphoglucosamine mutase [Naumannella halotolerans]
MAGIFGTDGVRGRANVDLTAELALDLSVAAAHVLGEIGAFEGHQPVALVGRDPRASGEFLEAAVVAGLASAGVNVVRLGVVPTPGVAYLVKSRAADIGVMISASHNPMPDNGIKFFSRGGVKLDDALEARIESQLRQPWQRPTGTDVGRVSDDPAAIGEYVAHLVESVRPVGLDNLQVVLDTANGAAFDSAPAAFRELGAEVTVIHDAPDGTNINEDCGSTHIESLQREVVARGAHAGFAFDGDADRCLAVDAEGRMIDGDQLLAILALALSEAGELVGETVVGTVMTNQGLVQAMHEANIEVRRTAVGDRYVLEAMNAEGFTLGGEQSGHVILSRWAGTGDGTLTALQVLRRMAETGKSLADLASVMHRLPQVLVNVGGVDKSRAGTDPVLLDEVRAASEKLADTGRVLLRPSGTENLVRVMVEAGTHEEALGIADSLAAVVRDRLAL